MKNLIIDLLWRGMIYNIIPGTEEHLQKGIIKGYIGFDPSADSLHLGNLVTIMLLKHLQVAGHKPIALIGGATGMIGDPSGRIKERPFLTEEVLYHNQMCIKTQLEKFLDFSKGTNQAMVLNNWDWFKDLKFLDFLRDVGRYIPIGYMMAKDSVKQRLEGGLSYAEFAYQLLQGYDFYYLYCKEAVTLQMGGSDQWGNLTTGVELIRKKANAQVFALTIPLLTRADGTKFGKTADGLNMWLDPKKTSPYALYQFLLNCSDFEVEKLIKIFAFYPKEAIESLILTHRAKPEQRLLQQELAKIIVTMVHSKADYQQALVCSRILFSHTTSLEDLSALSKADWQVIGDTIKCIYIRKELLDEVDSISTLLSVATHGMIMASKSQVSRMVASRGIMVNKILIEDAQQKPCFKLFYNQYILVQRGKKNHYLLIVQD